MTLAEIVGLGGWEITLILAIILILFGSKKLPDFAKRIGAKLDEHRKTRRKVVEAAIRRLSKQQNGEKPTERLLILIAITLGVICSLMILHELSK